MTRANSPTLEVPTVRFLADQTLDPTTIEEIRSLGNNIDQAEDDSERGALLERAVEEDRMVMSFDQNWYRDVFDGDAPMPRGVVCFDIEAETPHDPVRLIAIVMGAEELQLDGYFTLLGEESLKQKAL